MRMRIAVAPMDGGACVLLLLLYHTCLGLDVTAPPSQTALFQSRVVLPCTFRVTTPPINLQFLAIIWSFGTKELLRFDSKEKAVSDGVSFDEQAARQGNASLTIPNVTIANHGTYKCLVIYSPDRMFKEIQLSVQATPMVKIHKKGLHKNEKNQVDCSITGFFPKESLIVTWLRNDIEVLGGSKMGTFQTDGADGTFTVNSSIILTPDHIQDRPSIICRVEHVSLQNPTQDGFLVTYKVAPKVQLTSSKTADGNEYLYVCEAQGFSPEPLSINWLVDGKMTNLSRGSEDGLFNREIYYRINIKEGNVPKQISCNIQHEALNSPVTETLVVEEYNECKRHCHFGLLAVISTLLVLSLAVISYILWQYIRKKKYLQQFHVSSIHKEHVRGNEEKVNLYCMASKCPDVVKVTWMVTEEGQKQITIPESQAIIDEEAGPLINHEYTVKTDHTEVLYGLKNATTVLSFNPTISSHKNTKIICKLQCGERCEESALNFSFCYKKPSVKDSIHLSLDDSGNVVCSLTLENYYPRDVKIQWKCGVGNNLPSTEDIKNDSDYTFQCNSICRIPSQHFMDPGFKVRATWTHESLDQPGNQELSLKDFPWRPVMDDIKVPPLVHGREAKLQCVIRKYFPHNLEVKWLRRESGKPELYEVSSSDKYKIPELETAQGSDKTYTCTASVIVSVLLKTENKSEFICRVTHPSLETPLEKRTGERTVTGIPIVTRKHDGKHLTAEISHFYPKKIMVTWSRTKHKSELEDKFEPYDKKEYNVTDPIPESDGTYTLTSSVKKLDGKLYKITVEHESMESPIEKAYKKVKDTFEEVTEKKEEIAQGEMSDSEVAAQDGGEEMPTMKSMQPDKKGSWNIKINIPFKRKK